MTSARIEIQICAITRKLQYHQIHARPTEIQVYLSVPASDVDWFPVYCVQYVLCVVGLESFSFIGLLYGRDGRTCFDSTTQDKVLVVGVGVGDSTSVAEIIKTITLTRLKQAKHRHLLYNQDQVVRGL